MSTRTKVSDLFTRDEIKALSAPSDLAGWWATLSIWGVIALAFAMLAIWPNPFTFIVAVVILGGRQLALAILMHEASHHTLFRTRRLNDVVGNWLAGWFIWIDLHKYRVHHGVHHSRTGTDEDPDQSLVSPFPTTRASLRRKFLRDITGVGMFRRVLGLMLMDMGALKWTVASDVEWLPRNGRRWWNYAWQGLRNMAPVLLVHALLLGVLAAAGHAWVYLAWVVAYGTTFSLFLRIRSIAEHACTEQTPDMLRNTRTTRAGWLARATVAPLHVNYHIEHHVLPAIPWFRLRKAHRMLRDRGYVAPAPGYADVLRLAAGR